MDRVRHPRLSAAEKAELWRRWKRGESVSAIGRALGRIQGTGYHAVSVRGGVPPAPRRRSRWALTLAEREAISRGVACQWSFRRIGAQLGRAPSTVSREVRRPKPCRLATVPRLRTLVAAKLAAAWFPQQIAGWLRRPFPSDPGLHVSHETIYLRLFVQSRGVLRRELRTHLCQRRRMRRAKRAHPTGQRRGQIVDAVSIRERPAAAEDRAVPGQWEGDLLCGARNSHIATLVERHARFVLLVRLAGKDTRTVVQALTTAVRALPTGLMASSPGIGAWNSPATNGSRSPHTSRSTSAIRKAPGRGARTRTPTACCDSTCRAARTSPRIRKRTWTPLRNGSTPAHAKPSDMRRPRIDWPLLLHRPVELAGATPRTPRAAAAGARMCAPWQAILQQPAVLYCSL